MPQKIACVLGMHRSGTSAMTRILSALGAYLGPESMLVPAAVDNPTGFWELEPIVDINQSILTRFGGRAMDPPPLENGWATSGKITDLRHRAAALVETLFSASSWWAWKDPRACLTLPFWQEIIPPMHYVICVRRPAEVAASLRRRNNIPEARSIYLWLLYNRAALSASVGARRHFITYDDVMIDPIRNAELVAGFLGESISDESTAAIANFIDPARRHHRYDTRVDPENFRLAKPLLLAANDAYEMMSRGEQLISNELVALFDGALQS